MPPPKVREPRASEVWLPFRKATCSYERIKDSAGRSLDDYLR